MMDNASVISAYRRYAGVYDVLFGTVFGPGRERAVKALECRPGERVLEVGVGTGLSLPMYPEDTQVVGIDLSAAMLRQARRRARRHGLQNLELYEMDAQRMSFADNAFDKVAVMYVVSVVPDPAALLRELKRVCRPGGDIVIVNHFSHSHPLVSRVERFLTPMSGAIGFRPDLALDDVMDGHELEVVDVADVNLFGYWKLVHVKNCINGHRAGS